MATTNRYTKIQFRLQIKFSGESLHTVLSKKWKCGITMWRPNEHTDIVRPRPLRRVRGPAIICQRLRPWDVSVRACARRLDTHGHGACAIPPSIRGKGGHAGAADRSSERRARTPLGACKGGRGNSEPTIASAGASLIQQRQSSPLARCTRSPSSREGRLKPALSVVRSKHAD